MNVPAGQTVLVGGRRYKGPCEISDKDAKAAGLSSDTKAKATKAAATSETAAS